MSKARELLQATAVATITSALIFPTTAHAYVDPGSGSVIVTAVLGVIGAIGYTCRKWFYRAKNMFKRDRCKNDDKR